jgi:hypothetical protein
LDDSVRRGLRKGGIGGNLREGNPKPLQKRTLGSTNWMITIPDYEAFNWVIGPIGRCGIYVMEETRVAAVLHRALVVLAGLDPYLEIARGELEKASMSTKSIDELITQQKTLGPWAQELLAEDLHTINSPPTASRTTRRR